MADSYRAKGFRLEPGAVPAVLLESAALLAPACTSRKNAARSSDGILPPQSPASPPPAGMRRAPRHGIKYRLPLPLPVIGRKVKWAVPVAAVAVAAVVVLLGAGQERAGQVTWPPNPRFNLEDAYVYGDCQATFKRFMTDRPDQVEARMNIRCASQDQGTHEDYVHAGLPTPSEDGPIRVLWSAGYANCVVALGRPGDPAGRRPPGHRAGGMLDAISRRLTWQRPHFECRACRQSVRR